MGSEINATQAVAAKLRLKIFNGQWKPDAAMPAEAALCKTLGVSRTTLRQAFSMLIAEGLIQVRNGKGAFVLHYRQTGSLDLLGPMLGARLGTPAAAEFVDQILSLGSSALVAVSQELASRKERSLQPIAAAIAELKRATAEGLTLGEVMEQEELVFSAIAGESGNVPLMMTVATVSRALWKLRSLATDDSGFKLLDAQFDGLLEALRKGDKARAPELMKALVTSRDKAYRELAVEA